ncbi:MAG: ATP-binding protein [Myxococcota bacterium]
MLVFWLAVPASRAWDGGTIEVDSWSSRDGLPQNTVTDIEQTHDGYIWLTTFGGIARFDGVRFTYFDPANTPSLTTTRFVALAEGSDGTLWFGSEHDGVIRYDRGTHAFVPAGPPDLGAVWDITTIDGTVWIASDAGTFEVVDGALVLRDPRPSSSVTRRADGSRWLGAADGLVCVEGPCETLPPLRARASGFADGVDGVAYAASSGSIFRLAHGRWIEMFSSDTGWLVPTPVRWHGALWTADQRELIHLESPPQRVPLALPPTEGVRVLRVDREGGLWMGLNGGGLARARLTGVRSISPTSADITASASCVVVWSERGHWVVDGDPTCAEDIDGGALTGVWAPDGAVWWDRLHDDGMGHTLVRRDPDGTVVEHPLGAVVVEVVDGPYISAGAQVFAVDGAELVALPLPEGTSAAHVVRADPAGGVWAEGPSSLFRTTRDGVAEQVEPIGEAPVRDVLRVEHGIWAATYGGGVQWFGADGSRGSLTAAEGGCDNAVSRMLPTSDGYVWMNTNRGAGRIEASELAGFASREIGTVLCELVDSGEANGSGGVWAPGDRLFLPTIRGAVEIDASTAFEAAVPPLVQIEEASHGDEPLDDGEVVEGAFDMTVRYTALSFDDPLGVRFRHRLVGHRDGWTPLTTARHERFVDLPPGAYRFEVQARSARGVWSEPASLTFVRAPEWWETRLARVFLPLFGIGTVLALLLWRVRRTTRQNEELRREVHQRLRAEELLREQQAENELAAWELARARRLEAVGRLAGGVAHDFNNLLSVILGRMDLLRTHPDPEVAADAEAVVSAAERAAALTQQLLALGREDGQESAALDLGLAIQNARDLLDRLMRTGVALEIDVGSGVSVRIERSRLEQMLTNLCVNARDAILVKGTVSVRLAREVDGDGAWAVLTVEDDGTGIPPETVERIFEPYFTTKREGRGTGLGLATVHGAVEEAGGTIRVRSEVGRGTTFEIRLPEVSGSPVRSDPPEPAALIEGVRVLLVDDDDDVRGTVALQLGLRGAVVRAVATADAALEAVRAEPFDLLVTDVLMPEVSGTELAERVQAERAMPVLFISGHTGGELGMDDRSVLRKPFTSEALANGVLEVLGRVTAA